MQPRPSVARYLADTLQRSNFVSCKTEFGKFGDVLAKVKSQTETVLKTIDGAETRSRAMGRALKKVEALPDSQAKVLIPADKDFDQEPDAV